MDILDIFVKYWLQWIFGIIAAGIVFYIKRIIKLEKEQIKQQEQQAIDLMHQKMMEEIEEKIKTVQTISDEADKQLQEEIIIIKNGVENLTSGILSIQGKQFREECIAMLDPEHFILVDEYEQFEEDYIAYKTLGGNHNGDALHARVVEKFNAQIANLSQNNKKGQEN